MGDEMRRLRRDRRFPERGWVRPRRRERRLRFVRGVGADVVLVSLLRVRVNWGECEARAQVGWFSTISKLGVEASVLPLDLHARPS